MREAAISRTHVWGRGRASPVRSDGGAKVRWRADRNSHRWQSGGFYLRVPRAVPWPLGPLVTHDGGGSEVPGPGIWLQNEAGSPPKVALERGIKSICWTFDPLQSRNARLNISRLGAIGRRIPAGLLRALSQSFWKEACPVIVGWQIGESRPPGWKSGSAGKLRILIQRFRT